MSACVASRVNLIRGATPSTPGFARRVPVPAARAARVRVRAESDEVFDDPGEPDEKVIIEPRMTFGLDIHRRIHHEACRQMAYQAQWRAFCERCEIVPRERRPIRRRVQNQPLKLTSPPPTTMSTLRPQVEARLERLRERRRREHVVFVSLRVGEGSGAFRAREGKRRPGGLAAAHVAPDAGVPGDPGVVSRGGAEPVPGTGNVVPTLLRAWKEEIPAGAVERGERAKRRRRGGVERGGERAPREQFAVNERNLSFFWTTGSCNFAPH